MVHLDNQKQEKNLRTNTNFTSLEGGFQTRDLLAFFQNEEKMGESFQDLAS
jgi:hypothetical protein